MAAFLFLSLLLASVFLASAGKCATRTRSVAKTSPIRSGLGPFSYSDTANNGPANWGKIPCPGFKMCSSGHYQSPINIKRHNHWRPPCRLNLQVRSRTSALMRYRVAANDFSFMCDEPFLGCGHMTYRGVTYNLLQVHLHSPSEHTLDGKRFPMEIHFVHQNPYDKSLAVLGVFIQKGRNFNAPLNRLFMAARRKDAENVNLELLMSPVIAKPRPCTFRGSLTTPPCTEGVKWILSNTKIFATEKQIRQFHAMTDFRPNNRPLQSAQGRSIRCFRDEPQNDKRPLCTNEHY